MRDAILNFLIAFCLFGMFTFPMNHFSGAAAPAWDPSQRAGLQGWWKTQAGLTGWWKDTAGTVPCTSQSDSIARMDDYSGLSRHLLQATPSKCPTVNLAQQNGFASALTDGVDDVMAPASAINLGDNATLVCVYNTSQVSGQRSPFMTANQFCWHSSQTNKYGFFDSATHRNSTQTAISGIQIVVWTMDRGALKGKVYRNGAQIGGDVTLGNVTWNGFNQWLSGSAGFMNANFLELYCYNSTVIAADLANDFTYLNSRFAVY